MMMTSAKGYYSVGVHWFLLCFILKGKPAVYRSRLRTVIEQTGKIKMHVAFNHQNTQFINNIGV